MSLRDLLPDVNRPGPQSALKNLYRALTDSEIGEVVELFEDETLNASQIAYVLNRLAERHGLPAEFRSAKVATYRRERRYEP